MNPPGISYFYGALDSKTAALEISPSPPCNIAVAKFVASKDLIIVDLCNLPESPSVFDSAKSEQYEQTRFLIEFAQTISRPVSKDGREHVEYVPTQVLSEWYSMVFQVTEDGPPCDGLLYPSAVVPGGKNLVLFPTSRGEESEFGAVAYEKATILRILDWPTLLELCPARIPG